MFSRTTASAFSVRPRSKRASMPREIGRAAGLPMNGLDRVSGQRYAVKLTLRASDPFHLRDMTVLVMDYAFASG